LGSNIVDGEEEENSKNGGKLEEEADNMFHQIQIGQIWHLMIGGGGQLGFSLGHGLLGTGKSLLK